MWKKGDRPEHDGQHQREAAESDQAVPSPPRPAGQAIIGRSITIRGEVTGDEDLVIQGRVDGSVDLEQHAVTVGPEGHVKANITGRVVTVEGRVEGNVTGDEQVVLRKSSWVKGDLRAPRVVLESGAHFRGGVHMGEDFEPSRGAASTAARAASTEAARPPAPAQAIPPAAPVAPAPPAPVAARGATVKAAR